MWCLVCTYRRRDPLWFWSGLCMLLHVMAAGGQCCSTQSPDRMGEGHRGKTFSTRWKWMLNCYWPYLRLHGQNSYFKLYGNGGGTLKQWIAQFGTLRLTFIFEMSFIFTHLGETYFIKIPLGNQFFIDWTIRMFNHYFRHILTVSNVYIVCSTNKQIHRKTRKAFIQ